MDASFFSRLPRYCQSIRARELLILL